MKTKYHKSQYGSHVFIDQFKCLLAIIIFCLNYLDALEIFGLYFSVFNCIALHSEHALQDIGSLVFFEICFLVSQYCQEACPSPQCCDVLP